MTDTKGLKIGQTVTIRVDWAPEIKGKRAKVYGFQKNYNKTFVRVNWARDHVEMELKYGTIFSIDEVVAV